MVFAGFEVEIGLALGADALNAGPELARASLAMPFAGPPSEAARGALLGLAILAPLALFVIGAAARNAPAAIGGALAAIVGCRLAIALGHLPAPPAALLMLINAAIGASLIAFASAVLTSARESAALGAALLAGVLSMLGVGVINLALGGQAAAAITFGLGASVVVAFALCAHALWRGDVGGAFLAPALSLGGLGALAALSGGGFAVAGAGLSVIAVTAAALAACVRDATQGATQGAAGASLAGFNRDAGADRPTFSDATPIGAGAISDQGGAPMGEDAQIAQALDYVGVAVWDWSVARCRQTASFGAHMGADGSGEFTPDAMRAFIRPEARDAFERQVFGRGMADGAFDWSGDLVNGKRVRMRGARAVNAEGALERIVLFLEPAAAASSPAASPKSSPSKTAAAAAKGGEASSAGSAAAPKAQGSDGQAAKKGPAKQEARSDASLLSTAAASLAGAAATAAKASPDAKSAAPARDADDKGPKSTKSTASASEAEAERAERRNPFRRAPGKTDASAAKGQAAKSPTTANDGVAPDKADAPAVAARLDSLADDRGVAPDDRLAADRPMGRTRRLRQRSRILI